MISWALKRNAESAKDAPGPDDTQIEQPDTPAPVFAVRALRTALFGTPAPRETSTQGTAVERAPQHTNSSADDPKSPTKPTGILLTPGTGTTRRKRVSFGEGVKEGVLVAQHSTSGIPDEFPGKFPSPWHGDGDSDTGSRPKTRLTEAMENARRNRGNSKKSASGDEWEEYDDESEPDADVTIDLNEPHSRSGRYWKAYFENYHEEAKTEMEKLVKYKQLAKSYAKKKDTEAIDLNQKLKEEQERVKAMEDKVSQLARQISSKAGKSGTEPDSRLMSDLAKQTAMAVHYKEQVAELEALLNKEEPADDETDLLSRKTSPRTHKTLLETQRELRKARSQVRELDRVKNERNRLKSELKFAEQRATKLAEENKKLAVEASQPKSQDTAKVSNLERQLEDAKDEARRKDREIEKLRADYEALKGNAKTRYREAELVVKKKDDKIAELKREIEFLRGDLDAYKALDATRLEEIRPRATRNVAPIQAEENTTLLVQKELDKLRRDSFEKGLLTPSPAPEKARRRERAREIRQLSLTEGKLSPSPALKDNALVEVRAQAPIVLSDRANLHEPKRAYSSSQAYSAKPDALEKLSILSAQINSGDKASARAVSDNHRIRRRKTYLQSQPRPFSLPAALENEAPKADLVQDTFARLGAPGAEVNTSVMWNMNTSRTTLPEGRRAAAIARLERKKVERMRELVTERNKENQRPSVV